MKTQVKFGGSLEEGVWMRSERQLSDLMGKGKNVAAMKALNSILTDMPMFFVAEITHIEDGKKATWKVSGSRLRLANWLADAKLKDPTIEIVSVTSDRNQARGMATEV